MAELTCRVASVLLLIAASLGLLPAPARGWGTDGHRIVARIAAAELPSGTRDAVVLLLQKDRALKDCAKEQLPVKTAADMLACVASWADTVRNKPAYRFTGPFHFVNIPLTASAFDAARDCPAERGCVVSAPERYRKALADKSPGRRSERRDRSITQYAGALRAKITPAIRAQRAQGTVADWVNEAFRLAVEHGYDLPARDPNDRVCEVRDGHDTECTPFSVKACESHVVRHRVRLGQSYFDANVGLVDAQLTSAGIRLAKVLQEGLR